MPTPIRLAPGGLVRCHAAAAVGGVSLAWIAAAVLAAWSFTNNAVAGPWVAPAALVLFACGLLQAWTLWHVVQRGQLSRLSDTVFTFAILRRLLLAAALAYLAALAIGPGQDLVWAWLATVAAAQTLMLLPLATTPSVAEVWRRWSEGHAPRQLSWVVYTATLLLFASEGALRVYRYATEVTFLPVASASELQAVVPAEATLENPLAAISLEGLTAGRFRVALLGRPTEPAASRLSKRVQQTLPGAEIVPLRVALDHCDLRAQDVTAEVDAVRADLVLIVLPVCEDLAREAIQTSVFDWRQLELASLLRDGSRNETPTPTARSQDFETYLGEVNAHLAACRTPLNDTMRKRWERTYTSLDRAIAGCRAADVPMALVVVPGEFQLNPGLRDTLLRRGGVASEQFDLELPQRRLAGYAQQREVPLVDLLPHLRLCREAVYERHATTLNEQGNQAAASAISGWLASRYGDRLAAQLSKAP